MASIVKRKDSYRIVVSNGRRADGTQIIETTTWKPDPGKTKKQNEKALQVFAAEFEEKVKAGKILDGVRMTVQQFSEMWLRDGQNGLEDNTTWKHEHYLERHILPEIGHMKMADVKPKHIVDLLNKLAKDRKDGRDGGYSRSTIQNVKNVCSAMFNTAIDWQVVNENPCKNVRVPKIWEPEKNNFFTPVQTGIFLEYLEENYLSHHKEHDCNHPNGSIYHVAEYTETHSIPLQLRILYNLAVYCGFRRGELIGLTWDNVDFKNKTILISQSTVQVNGKAITKDPKSKTSRRVVSVPAEVMDMLKQYRKEYLEYQMATGSYWRGEGKFIFIQKDGTQMFPDTPTKAIKKIIRRYNKEHPDHPLPEISLHGLRHTNATLSLYSGTDIKAVSKRLGHSKASTTMDIYAHALEETDREAAENVANLIRKNIGGITN